MASINDDKVMDVSKPGKGKIVPTSRPVVTQADNAKKPAETTDAPKDEPKEALASAPSVSHKVIQPLTDMEKPDEKEAIETEKPEEETATAEELKAEDKAESTPAESTTDGSAEAAGVDELAKAAEAKKLASKEAEEQAKRDAELQKLIDSKKYAVPISGGSKGGGKVAAVFVAVIILMAVIGYILVDMGVVGSNIKLPFEFFKESQADQTSKVEQKPESKQNSENEENTTESAPIARANDDDIKNELKNLQQKLETYFNDKDEYPSSISELALTEDELTDDNGSTYTYTSTGDTYTLTAQLSTGTEYELHSVN